MRQRPLYAAWLLVVPALLLLVWHAAAQGPTLARYPYLQNVRTDRATVMWATREPGFGLVEFGADRSFSRAASAIVREVPRTITGTFGPYFQYQADLTGLVSGTEYFYRVLVDGDDVTFDDLRFRTAGSGPFQFLAFGDSGGGSPEQFRLAQVMLSERPSLVLHTGDIAYPSGAFEHFQGRYFDVYREMMKRVPFFTCPGNHDYETAGALPYLTLHAPPTEGVPPADRGRYYSFDWGDVHFVSLDTNLSLAAAVSGNGPMLQWLDQDLRRTPRLWRIVYFHHPAHPTSNHEGDEISRLVRERVEPILDRNEVQLVLNGHEHNYQQSVPFRNGEPVAPSTGAVHVITGGGGAPLYSVIPQIILAFGRSVHHYVRGEVQGSRLVLRAIDLTGDEIDNFTITTPPILSGQSTVNAASFTTALAPGALISIFGRRLALEDNQANTLPLPNELSGAIVRINGRRLPLLYVSRNQINAQLLFDVSGPATLQVTTPGGAVDVPVTLSEPAPAIFSTTAELGRSPAVLHSNGSLVSDAAPARPGEILSIYMTGLGQPNGDIVAGQAAPVSPLLTAQGPVEVVIGTTPVMPSFAGLAPGFAGLYQVNVTVPVSVEPATYGLRVVARGVTSNTVSLVVRR